MRGALALVQRSADRLAQLAATIHAALRGSRRNALVIGRALLEAEDLLLPIKFNQWVKETFGFNPRMARYYKSGARHWAKLPEAERQRVAALPIRQIIEALRKPSRWSCCTGNFEWYSPRPIVEAARGVLGRIDLDPASCEVANDVVKATSFFSKEVDGLKQTWAGKVWMNPPFAKGLIEKFVQKLVAHVQDGSVTSAIMLVNSATEVRWFETLSSAATAVCFPTGRLSFWKPGKKTATPPLGQAILYFGPDPHKFQRAFRQFGHVWFAKPRIERGVA